MNRTTRSLVLSLLSLTAVFATGCVAEDADVSGPETTNSGTSPLVLGCESTTTTVGTPAITWPPALSADFGMTGGTPTAQRLSRGGIEYLAGNNLTIVVDTDACTGIRSITRDATTLTPNRDDILDSYTSSEVALGGGMVRRTVNIKVPPRDDGATEALSIQFGPTLVKGTSVTATRSWTLVRASRVDAKLVPRPVGMVAAELHNKFASALWTKFNGATNSTTVVDDGGTTRRIYGYDPSSLSVTPTIYGVNFSFRFSSEVDHLCDPRVTAHGSFSVRATAGSPLGIFWNATPVGDLSWPTSSCSIWSTIATGAVSAFLPSQSGLRSSLEPEIQGALPDPGPAIFYLAGSTNGAGGVNVNLALPVPVVTIQVPYKSVDEPATVATKFPAGARIGLLGYGGSRVDGLVSGPVGLPASASYPAAKTLSRVSTSLPWSTRPVGNVLFREVPTVATVDPPTVAAYDAGCAWSPSYPVAFSVNDTALMAQWNRTSNAATGYPVGIAFYDANNVLAAGATTCKVRSTAPVIVMR